MVASGRQDFPGKLSVLSQIALHHKSYIEDTDDDNDNEGIYKAPIHKKGITALYNNTKTKTID